MAWKAFWITKRLEELTSEEWESLCDGCGKCCLHKLEDEDDGQVYYTNVVCRLLSLANCQCTDYKNRLKEVPDCLNLKPDRIEEFGWLPSTCAYRLRAQGKPLPDWHHLNSGSYEAMHKAGMSVKDKVIPEAHVAEEDLEDCIVHWVN